MNADLRRRLQEAAPPPRDPIDVDGLFERVDRRRTGRHAAATATVLAALAVVLGVSQLLGDQRQLPIVDDVDDTAGTCDGGADEQILAGIDLDGDGLNDRARLDVNKQVLVACLGNGETARASTEHDDPIGPTAMVEAVDLGGTHGVALIHHGAGDAPEGRWVVLVRWIDGQLAAVQATDPDQTPVPGLASGQVFTEGAGQTGPQVYGCKPTPDSDDFEVLQLSASGGHNWHVRGLASSLAPDPSDAGMDGGHNFTIDEPPGTHTKAELQQVLQDHGYTPRCLDEDGLHWLMDRIWWTGLPDLKTDGATLLRRLPDDLRRDPDSDWSENGDWEEVDAVDSDYPLMLRGDDFPLHTLTVDRFIAVGPSQHGVDSMSTEHRIQVFMSVDGVTWETSEITDFGPMECEIHGCVIGPGGGEAIAPNGVLIVRNVTRPGFDDDYPHVWFSPDGTAPWQRADLPSDMLGRFDTDIELIDGVVALPDGGFRLWIYRQHIDDERHVDDLGPEIWESLDGLTWRMASP